MKKVLFTMLIAGWIMNVAAQENMMSKRGTSILPEIGDFGVGISADPFLSYLGNMFNQNGNQAPFADYAGRPYSFTFLYVDTTNHAYRGLLQLGFGSHKEDSIVPRLGSIPDLFVTNIKTINQSSIAVGGGIQWSRGKHRLHANYGADAFIGYGSNKTSFDYGQALDDTNTVTRVLEDKSGSTFGLGVRGFLTVEYFVAPKISVAFQYGWGISFESTGEGETKTESWNAIEHKVDTKTTKTGKSSSFNFGSDGQGFDLNGGSITATFYF